jgi:hypothetical protein
LELINHHEIPRTGSDFPSVTVHGVKPSTIKALAMAIEPNHIRLNERGNELYLSCQLTLNGVEVTLFSEDWEKSES